MTDDQITEDLHLEHLSAGQAAEVVRIVRALFDRHDTELAAMLARAERRRRELLRTDW